ncbi:ribonuclease H-like domain-containing protein [Cristinia sonorae]|uniref:Ribonuclease H-like domain-containing protein n=1 Tax=Cristinia sonorae TaxID=1940300 RepID=A0A8K0UUD0_9AGAR|nr:ribonuclease H-like domain-containing protein [Cristinia sonorae]
MAGTVPYLICNTAADCHLAYQILYRASFLILDCEGNNLGRAGGCVTLICVGTPLAENIFLFDTLSPALSPRDLDPLWQLFSSPLILKIVWDGRMDYLELWSSYKVRLEGVLDLQVAEVVSRVTMRGEGEEHRLGRLANSYFSKNAVQKHGEQYEGINVLIGLQQCCQESGLGEEFVKDPEVKQMHKDKKADMWTQRPLPGKLLQYAAKDIQLISMLCTVFIQRCWIPSLPGPYNTLLAQCARYVSAHVEQGKSEETDPFRPTGLMPLDVLTQPWGLQYKCTGCNRSLSMSCYTLDDSDGFYRRRRTRCNLCHVLATKYRLRADPEWFVV